MIPETSDYLYKTEPYEHQHKSFLETRDAEAWAYLWEMGLGKSKIVCDVAAYLYAKGEIDFLLVVAPNGVHANWITDEIVTHMPDWTNYRMALWSSSMNAKQSKAVESLFEGYNSHPRPLRVLAMNIEAYGVQARHYREKAGKLARAVLNVFDTMMVVDESSFIKNWVNRTKRIIELGQHAKYRRILNGTPVTNSPLDLYYQFKFLNGGGVSPGGKGAFLLGPYSTNKASFEGRYAVYEEKIRKDKRKYRDLIGHQNIDELSDYLEQCSTRLTKDDCLDLPDKIYMKLPITLHKEQQTRYDKLIEEGILELTKDDEVTVNNVLTLWLRAQQIVGGFLPSDTPEDGLGATPIFKDPKSNPRVAACLNAIEQTQTGKVIIVCRFLAEAKMWMGLLGDEAVSYVGKANYKDPDQREINRTRFQGRKENNFKDHDPSVRFMVMNKAGFRGLTLTHARTMIFYSNSFSLDDRLQCEDRAHRIGQEGSVTYIDCHAEGTIDDKLIQAYRQKKQLADLVTRDDPKTWL